MFHDALVPFAERRIIQMIKEITELYGKKILLTGITGMIGRALIRCLMEENEKNNAGIQITGVSRNQERANMRLDKYMASPLFTYHAADINEPLPEMGSFDYIIHGASNTHPKQYSSDPIGTIAANVWGTKNLLDYMVKHDCGRFVFLSSVEIYGENRGDTETFTEDYLGYIDCNTLRAGYPESKRLGETLCNAYAKQYNIDFVIPRLSRVYGPGLLDDDSKAISQFIHKAAAGENIVLKSKGNQLYSYTYEEDCAEAILLLMLKGKSGEAYNVADPKSTATLAELAQILADIAGTEVVFELPDEVEAAGYSTATKAILNTNKLESFEWIPQIEIHKGLKKTVEEFKGNKIKHE